jgi:hypothetical protein
MLLLLLLLLLLLVRVPQERVCAGLAACAACRACIAAKAGLPFSAAAARPPRPAAGPELPPLD